MTNKKVRVWLIFFVKLLPLVLLIGFMLYFFRHELPETEDVESDSYSSIEYYSWSEFNSEVLRLSFDSSFRFPNQLFVDFNLVNPDFLTYIDDFVCIPIGQYVLHADGDSIQVYLCIIFYDSVTYMNFVDFSDETQGLVCDYVYNYNDKCFYLSEDLGIFDYVEYFNIASFPICPFIKDKKTLQTYDYDHTNYFDNIVKQFDDFTTSNFNFIDSFNFNDFYDFTVEHLVHNPSPIYHSVFNIMIYEIIVDLMLLLFGAFAFVINWSRKWLEGIYEKW